MSSKKQEIKALSELVEMDGYFAEYFKADLAQMIDNITKDFPIELSTNFHAAAEFQMAHNDKLVKTHTEEIIDLCDTLLCINADTGNERAYERAVDKLGLNFVIARKRQIGLSLTNAEIDYLISQLQK